MEASDYVFVRNRFGYVYRYKFSLDEDIIPRCIYQPSIGVKTLVFELRTNFMVRTTEGEEILGSEKLYAVGKENESGCPFLMTWSFRLREYWFPLVACLRFSRNLRSFAAKAASQDPHDVIPVAVEFDVCTVQQPEEAASAAVDRAIRPEHMVPIYVCAPKAFMFDKASEGKLPIRATVIGCFLSLPTIRVKDVDEGLKLMSVCSICGRSPVLGTKISPLRCNHAFHYHCLVNWLHDKDYSPCPLCVGKDKNDGDNGKEEDVMSLLSV